MSKVSKRSVEAFDESDLFPDEAFDLHEFIDPMEGQTGGGKKRRTRGQSGRQRLDDLSEARWLRWDDWPEDK